MELSQKERSRLATAAFALMVLAAIYFAVRAVAEVKNIKFIGGGVPAANTVSFSGNGEVFAAPDIALVNITIREEAKTVAEAQGKATTKEKAVLDFLAKEGIANKDIKTESYNSYPKYDYGTPCYDYRIGCRETPKVIGYEVSENVAVKVRELDKAGTIVSGTGTLGISEISGPYFSIENEDDLKAQARKIAIDEAKAKAETLAKDLGVRLVRIVNFSEDGYYPSMYTAKDARLESAAGVSAAPVLPIGENKITSNVTIVYEIR